MSVLKKRINRVIDHVRANLQQELSLEHLAQVAGLSQFHFHRLFKDQVGQTLNAFVVRQRLEWAAKLLQADSQLNLTEAASQAGFASLSDFSRNFKAHYGLAASRWDRITPLHISKIRQTQTELPLYAEAELAAMNWSVEVREIPAQTLVYLRVAEPYSGSNIAVGLQVFEAALEQERLKVCGPLLGMSLDDPEVTPLEHSFYDWAVAVETPTSLKGALNLRQQPVFSVASIAVQGDIAQVDQAWQYLYRCWLPRSPYLPANLPAIEAYRQSPSQSGWEVWNLECWLPIKEEYEPGDFFS